MEPCARSLIVVTCHYSPKPSEMGSSPFPALNIAKYAQGEDYHQWFLDRLKGFSLKLEALEPGALFLPAVDTKALLERELAKKAGLGWYGKNTCLIHPKAGSYFFIGEILTDLELTPSQPFAGDHCGTCTRCIEACPTQALGPEGLDARQCLSFHNIESRNIPSLDIRTKMGDLFFGCDICQDVCPWNLKLTKALEEPTPPSNDQIIADLKVVLSSSGKQLERLLKNYPLLRARPWGLKRNALVVVGNLRLKELEPFVKGLLGHPKLSSLAHWTLQCLED